MQSRSYLAQVELQCHVSLPIGENTTSQVLIYFYDGKWVPTIYCPLADAIELHRRAALAGREFFVFPADLDLSNLQLILNTSTDTSLPHPILSAHSANARSSFKSGE
jgi:hypothetical protein